MDRTFISPRCEGVDVNIKSVFNTKHQVEVGEREEGREREKEMIELIHYLHYHNILFPLSL